jgi:ketosteroid isomerase-like protein
VSRAALRPPALFFATLVSVAPGTAVVAASAGAMPSVALPAELERVLADYESARQRRDAAALAGLFTDDGFVLSDDSEPVRGRDAIRRHYGGAGGPLALRAYAYGAEGSTGYILGAFGRSRGGPDVGKFTLVLRRDPGGRWLIISDMDNGIRRSG